MTPPLPQGSSYPSYRLPLAVATCLAWKHLKLFIKSILHLTHWIKSRKMRWFSNGISITVLVVKWTRVSQAPIHVLPFWRLLTCLSWVFFVFVLFVNGILIFAVAVCRCFALEVPSSEFNKHYCQWKISIGCSKRRRGMLPKHGHFTRVPVIPGTDHRGWSDLTLNTLSLWSGPGRLQFITSSDLGHFSMK